MFTVYLDWDYPVTVRVYFDNDIRLGLSQFGYGKEMRERIYGDVGKISRLFFWVKYLKTSSSPKQDHQ